MTNAEQNAGQPVVFTRRNWAALLILGLAGQLAWMIENMYFNVFIYETVTGDPRAVATMVAASAVTATVTTLLMGALSDRAGRRKPFITIGYFLWGLSVMAFSLISVERTAGWFPQADAVALTVTIIVIMDCVMTFFGSTANDAAFNAWVTDVSMPDNRGRVETVLAILPLLAILIIFGGFSALTAQGRWGSFFMIFGLIMIAASILSVPLLREPQLSGSKQPYLEQLFYGFRPSVIRANGRLYTALTALFILSASTQVWMPYLIVYFTDYLRIENYAPLLGLVILLGSAAGVLGGRLLDKRGKLSMALPALALAVAGLAAMAAARQTVWVVVSGFLMLAGNLVLSALVNGLVRDYTPQGMAGRFQGIRMIFGVMLPMVTAPYLGAAVIRNSGETYVDLGVVRQVPTPGIFLAGALILLALIVPLAVLKSGSRTITGNGEGRPVDPSLQLQSAEGQAVDPDHPLPEYPRPQMVRRDWQNLNGRWDYAIRLSGEEAVGGAPAFPQPDGRIIVPFSPESLLSGVSRQLLPGETLWYRLRFEAALRLDGRVLLHFGAVDQRCRVWLNGRLLGEHEDGYLPFTFDVTDEIQAGNNELVLAVEDDSDQGWLPWGKQKLKRGRIWYTAQSGIWQTVWLESVPQDYVSRVVLTQDADRLDRLDFRPELAGGETASGWQVTVYEATLRGRDNPDFLSDPGRALLGSEQTGLELPADEVRAWAPDSPWLYPYELKMGSDRVRGYFALRTVGIEAEPPQGGDGRRSRRMLLNGQPLFRSGVLDQGYWSDGLYTAPTDQALIDDVLLLKELGFNLARKHIKVEALRWYFHCDRLGLLVSQDMVSGGGPYHPWITERLPFVGIGMGDRHYRRFGRNDPRGRAAAKRHQDAVVELLRSVPSIESWVPFNEGWGQFDAVRMAERLRRQDPTRLIDHASGWYDQGGPDFRSLHIYFKPVKLPVDERPVILSEFGGYSCRVDGHSTGDRSFGYKRYPDLAAMRAGIRDLYRDEIIPQRDRLAGTVYTQLSDVEDEVNGLITYDRRIAKWPQKGFKALNDALICGTTLDKDPDGKR